ncbi:unnamed protein product [Linum trigynum]|uniref:Uncharacterized protein n=1 Tax=Linum trigynum TaxID=586398 RepID=A0AAV2EIV4_9ROSI
MYALCGCTHFKFEQVEVNGLPIVALPPQQPKQPMSRVLESVQGLCNLSSDIQEFKNRFDELEKHLDLIRTAIESHEQPDGQVDYEVVALAPSAAEGAVPASSELLNLVEVGTGTARRRKRRSLAAAGRGRRRRARAVGHDGQTAVDWSGGLEVGGGG